MLTESHHTSLFSPILAPRSKTVMIGIAVAYAAVGGAVATGGAAFAAKQLPVILGLPAWLGGWTTWAAAVTIFGWQGDAIVGSIGRRPLSSYVRRRQS